MPPTRLQVGHDADLGGSCEEQALYLVLNALHYVSLLAVILLHEFVVDHDDLIARLVISISMLICFCFRSDELKGLCFV